MATNWEALGAQKREAITAAIPKEWIIPSIPTVEEVKDITGSYIQQFLSPKEVEITETDAVAIVQSTTSGVWSAVEVAKAFCHRAALAHQLVGEGVVSFCCISTLISPSGHLLGPNVICDIVSAFHCVFCFCLLRWPRCQVMKNALST
jgi:hypothetical protein